MLPVRKSIGGLGNLLFKQAYIYAQMRRGEIPDIYVQSEKYWKDYAEEIKQLYATDVETTDMVSLHIRRGDYLDTDFYVDLTKTDYYKKATDMFPNDKFLVFYKDRQNEDRDEEDRKWVENFLDEMVPDRWDHCISESETDDLNKMASCKSNIGSNSSFSWWGCYLNQNSRKVCVMPSEDKWFTDGFQRIDLLDEWVKV